MARVIYITHFLNPNCFYFKFDDDLHDIELQNLEDEITKSARSKFHAIDAVTLNDCDIGETVAAYETTWGKWVRAEVREHLRDIGCYQLWAIDHGKLFRAAYKHVTSLSRELSEKSLNTVHRGSIYGVVAAKLDFNPNTFETELVPMKTWLPKAVYECNMLLTDKNVVRICYDIKVQRGDYYFGDIVIETWSEKPAKILSTNIGHALVSIEQAVQIDFKKEMDRIVLEFSTLNEIKTTENRTYQQSQLNNRQIVTETSNETRVEPLHPPASTVIDSEIDDGKTRMKIGIEQRKSTQSIVASTVLPSEIDGGITRMQLREKMHNFAPSVVASTTLASEIDGGATRMQMQGKKHNFAPSMVGSEIDDGATRMQMNRQRNMTPYVEENSNETTSRTNNGEATRTPNNHQSNPRCSMPNGNLPNRRSQRAYMPAGYERETLNFDKYNR